MKLLFCPRCHDVFRLFQEPRSCACGVVSGRYLRDGRLAQVNGQGVSLAIGNGSLIAAIYRLRGGQVAPGERADVLCWVRPHEGPENPHTRVVRDAEVVS